MKLIVHTQNKHASDNRMDSALVEQLVGAVPFLLVGIGITGVISKNQSKWRLVYATAAVCLLTALKMGRDQASFSPNYYSVLGVRRHSDPALFRAAYKERSLQLHPDKNPAPDAQSQFNLLKSAYDALSNEKRRDIYNFFGEAGLKSDPRIDELQLVLDILLSYMLWFAIAIFVTMGLSSGHGRMWACTIVALMLSLEASVLVYNIQLPSWYPFSITEHEFILWIRRLLPPLILLCRTLGRHLCVDHHAAAMIFCHLVQQRQKATRGLLHQLHTQMHRIQSGDKELSHDTLERKISELEQELAGNDQALSTLHNVLKAEQQEGSSSVYWLLLIVLYVVFTTVFA